MSYNPLKVDAAGSSIVTLGTKIAGEDLTNDRQKVSNEVALQVIHEPNALSMTAGLVHTGASVDCSNYRRFTMSGLGYGGTIKLLLQISPDGSAWFWHPNGETASGQYPSTQQGYIEAAYCRVVATNTFASTQSVEAWLTLSR